MINHDLLIGLGTGAFYGYLFRPIFQFFFRHVTRIFKRSLLPTGIVLIFIGLVPSIGAFSFLLTVLIFKPIVVDWKAFVAVFFVCFMVGMGVYAVMHRKQISKWD